MRPEQSGWVNSPSARKLQVLAAILLVFPIFLAPALRATESAPQTSASPAYDSDSFVKELGRLKTGLGSAQKSTETLRAYRESLPQAWAVDSGGRHYDVPTDLLVSRLDKAEKEPELRRQQIEQARDYLDALAAETVSLSVQPPQSTVSARTKLNAILARSEYKHARQRSWWEILRDRISEILQDALDRIFRRVGGQSSLGYALLWIGVCAAAILIGYWIFHRWFRAAKGVEMALQSAAVPLRSWQEWLYAARESAGRGDHRMAIHCAYWAGITRLQDLGALAPDRAKTPREYLRALAKAKLVMPETLATRQQALSLLTSRLEKIWYGYQIATEADFRDSLTQLETLGCHLP
jgi:hypothetical protein